MIKMCIGGFLVSPPGKLLDEEGLWSSHYFILELVLSKQVVTPVDRIRAEDAKVPGNTCHRNNALFRA
jgi:hypothetical protein